MNTRRSLRNAASNTSPKITPNRKSPKRKHESSDSNENENSSNDSSSDDSNDMSFVTVVAKNKQSKNVPKRKHEDGSSSDSSVGDYLKNPDEIDLNSSFFTSNIQEKPPDFASIEKKIFGGIQHLSDSEDSDELPVEIPVNSEEISDARKVEQSEKVNFSQLREYNKKLEEAKACVEKYEKHKKPAKKLKAVNNQEITKLLKLGETKNEAQTSINSIESDLDNSDEDEMDWQEIEESNAPESTINIPKDGVQITVELPQVIRKKSKGFDMMAAIKRRINRVKKENQIYVHKVHLLCWIAHGNFINSILNDSELLAPALSLLPSDKCYPPKHADMSYLEQIVKWYGKMIKLIPKKQEIDIKESLQTAISNKTVFSKRDFVLIFIVILRSLGLQCRLVFSLQCLPLRPPSSELCSLSTKENEAKETKNNKKEEASTSKSGNKSNLNKSVSKNSNSLNKSVSKDKKSKSSTKSVSKTLESKKLESKKSETKKPESKNLGRKKTESRKSEPKKSEPKKLEQKKPEPKKLEQKKSERKKPEPKSRSTQDEKKPQERKSTRTKNKISTESEILKISQVDGADDDDTTKRKTKPSIRIKLKKNLNESVSSTSELVTLNNKNKNLLDTEDHDFKPKKRSSSSKSPKDINGNKNNASEKSSSKKTLSEKLQLNKIKTEKCSPKPSTSSSALKLSGSTKSSPKLTSSPIKSISEKLQLNKIKTEKSSPRPSTSSNNSPKKISERLKANEIKTSPKSSPFRNSNLNIKNDIINLIKGDMSQKRLAQQHLKVEINSKKESSDYDSDYFPDEEEIIEKPLKKRKSNNYNSEDEFKFKINPNVKRRVKPNSEIDSRIISSDEESIQDSGKKKKVGNDVWIEVFLEEEEKWISVDLIKEQIHCVSEIHSRASQPVSYILAWNNDLSLKDVTARYCPNWNTVTRKLRVDSIWWKQTLKPFSGIKTARDKEEDEDLARQQLDKPLPTTISEYKNHPLYALKRHLLKFEAIYPPNAVTLGFVRKEAVYARECVHTLHSREIWVKHAKVVKPAQEPYKIVKARPKYDKLTGNMITDLPLEIFGSWQVDDYVPPTAENGIVPRNAFGNVELFKACMLPKKTVHLQLPGLNKVCRKLQIDCAPAVVGFDFHSGFSHPMFDGYVVCEEFKDTVIAAWEQDQVEIAKKEQEKYDKRVWGNWRKLIKAVLIRERLKRRYDFGPVKSSTSKGKTKSKGPKVVLKKRKICSSDDEEWTDVE